MTWQHDCLVRQDQKLVSDGGKNQLIVSAGKIGSANIVIKQSVAAEQQIIDQQRDAARRVTGSVNDTDFMVTKFELVTVGKLDVGLRKGQIDFQIGTKIEFGVDQHIRIRFMNADRGIQPLLEKCVASYVIGVAMSIDNVLNFQLLIHNRLK